MSDRERSAIRFTAKEWEKLPRLRSEGVVVAVNGTFVIQKDREQLVAYEATQLGTNDREGASLYVECQPIDGDDDDDDF